MASEFSIRLPRTIHRRANSPGRARGGQTWIHLRSTAAHVRRSVRSRPRRLAADTACAAQSSSAATSSCRSPTFRIIVNVYRPVGEQWGNLVDASGRREESGHDLSRRRCSSHRPIPHAVARQFSRILHLVHSMDGGRTWSAPSPTGIIDYPADLGRTLADGPGRLRHRPQATLGISLYISEDGGESWKVDDEW